MSLVQPSVLRNFRLEPVTVCKAVWVAAKEFTLNNRNREPYYLLYINIMVAQIKFLDSNRQCKSRSYHQAAKTSSRRDLSIQTSSGSRGKLGMSTYFYIYIYMYIILCLHMVVYICIYMRYVYRRAKKGRGAGRSLGGVVSGFLSLSAPPASPQNTGVQQNFWIYISNVFTSMKPIIFNLTINS